MEKREKKIEKENGAQVYPADVSIRRRAREDR